MVAEKARRRQGRSSLHRRDTVRERFERYRDAVGVPNVDPLISI